MPFSMGGILLDAKTDRHGPHDPPHLPPPSPDLHLKAAIISLTMTQFTVSVRLPSHLVSIRVAAVDVYLIGRGNQDLTSGGRKRRGWTLCPLVKFYI